MYGRSRRAPTPFATEPSTQPPPSAQGPTPLSATTRSTEVRTRPNGSSPDATAASSASSTGTTLRTFLFLREIVPGLGTLAAETRALEGERAELTALWRDGKRAQAVELAERLVARTPAGLDRVFYSDDGSTAVEVALKAAYQSWVRLCYTAAPPDVVAGAVARLASRLGTEGSQTSAPGC